MDASKALPTEAEKAVAFHDNVLPAMDALRAAADDAETICGCLLYTSSPFVFSILPRSGPIEKGHPLANAAALWYS